MKHESSVHVSMHIDRTRLSSEVSISKHLQVATDGAAVLPTPLHSPLSHKLASRASDVSILLPFEESRAPRAKR